MFLYGESLLRKNKDDVSIEVSEVYERWNLVFFKKQKEKL